MWPEDINFLEEFFNFEKIDQIINKRYMITRKNEDKKFIVKSIVTDGYGCSIIYDVKPKVNIILENMKDPVAQKIPKIFENYNNSKCLKYLKEPSARVPKDEKKEDAIIRSVFEEAKKCQTVMKFTNHD